MALSLAFFHLVDALVKSEISGAMINCQVASIVNAYIGVGVLVLIGLGSNTRKRKNKTGILIGKRRGMRKKIIETRKNEIVAALNREKP